MFLHDAQERTESWRLRHSPEAIATLGVWRWKGIQAHIEDILRECLGKRVIDFGGSGGPLGLGSIVVDREDSRKQQLSNVEGQVDVIFSSHTLEHCEDLLGTLLEMRDKLVSGGALILHVPAWTCQRWRANDYNNPNQSKHLWTFSDVSFIECFGVTSLPDVLTQCGLSVEQAEHCGDDSIFILARKP